RLDDSLRIREARSRESPLSLAQTLELVGRLHRYDGRYGEAGPPLDRALELRRRYSPVHPDTASAQNLRGYIFYLAGDMPAARRMWESALTLARRTLRPGHPLIAEYESSLMLGAWAFGDLAEVRQLSENALEIAETSLAGCDPQLAWIVNN